MFFYDFISLSNRQQNILGLTKVIRYILRAYRGINISALSVQVADIIKHKQPYHWLMTDVQNGWMNLATAFLDVLKKWKKIYPGSIMTLVSSKKN